MGLNLDATPEELQMFLVEVDEHLQNLENSLLHLEKETDNNDLLQEIFRSSHTLKGSSATIGHNRMAKLTHSMENVLDKLRKHQLVVTSALITELFECLDYLKILKDEIMDDQESDLDLNIITGKLEALITDQPRTEKLSAKENSLKNNVKSELVNKNLKQVNHTVRVDVDLLDGLMNLVGELVIDRTRLLQVSGELESFNEIQEQTQDLGRTSLHIARITTQLQELIMKARMLPVENLFNKFPRMVRDLSHKAGKEIDFIMTGQETELDRSIIEEIGDPLIHLLRNAVDHGIEPPEERKANGKSQRGQLKLKAAHEENQIIITLRDDGKGINPETIRTGAVQKGLITEDQARRLSDKEAVNLIFISGLSTNAKVTDVSGRGVGMDVVKTNIDKINGSVEINSIVGQGSEFKIKLPLTLAIIRALLISIGQSVYAVPLSNVKETIRIQRSQIEYINSREVIELRGKVLPLIKPHHFLNKNTVTDEIGEKLFVVVIHYAKQDVGLIVDSLVGEQEIVIKSLGKYIGDTIEVAGATILGDGNVAIILDIAGLIQKFVQ